MFDNSQYFEFIREEYYDREYATNFKNTLSGHIIRVPFKKSSKMYISDPDKYIIRCMRNSFIEDYFSTNLILNPIKIYEKDSDVLNRSSKQVATIKSITNYIKKDHYVATVSSTIY